MKHNPCQYHTDLIKIYSERREISYSYSDGKYRCAISAAGLFFPTFDILHLNLYNETTQIEYSSKSTLRKLLNYKPKLFLKNLKLGEATRFCLEEEEKYYTNFLKLFPKNSTLEETNPIKQSIFKLSAKNKK